MSENNKKKKDAKKEMEIVEKSEEKNIRQVSLHSSIEKFVPEKGKWKRWVKRLETTFKLFAITEEEEKKNNILHYMGLEAYDKLSDEVLPQEPEDLAYDTIVAKLEKYFDPKPVVAAECFKFHTRMQHECETVTEYMGELKKLAKYCGFGCSVCGHLSNTLMNQFIVGVKNRAIRNRLMETHDLTMEKALDVATAMEASDKSSNVIAGAVTKPAEIEVEVKKLEKTEDDVCKVSSGGARRPQERQEKPSGSGCCYRCGLATHYANSCFHAKTVCRQCGKTGHLQRVCKQAGKKKTDDKAPQGSQEVHGIEGIFTVEEDHVEKVLIDVKVNEQLLQFEMDSGSAISIAGIEFRDKHFPHVPISETQRKFVGYGGKGIGVLGFIRISPVVGGRVLKDVNLYLSEESSRRPLLGREWIKKMDWIDWNVILELNQTEESVARSKIFEMTEKLKRYYAKVFDKSRGKIEGIQAELRLKDNAKPVFIKERSVAFSKKKAVEKEIQKLVDDGVLRKVNQSNWATPVVAIFKPSGGVRLCGDYSVTLNPELVIDQHPLPTIDELFADMAGGEKFTKLDLSQAYLQLEVRESDRELLTLSTHLGLYEPTRLMYGVASAVAVWQRLMENELKDIPGVKVFVDDIKITGPDDQTHWERVREVLKRLQERNMRVNLDKCEFFQDNIIYCGYVIDKDGIHKHKEKVEALEKMPRPTDKDEVHAYLGFVNYYGRFFEHLSTVLDPIYKLLQTGVPFKWTKECERAWCTVKREMLSDKFLDHYNPQLPLRLATDASPVGVGACISQLHSDGAEKPVQYASRSLTKTQRNYSQMDREAYGIVFGLKKFYPYLFGRRFTLITDNKALYHIFNPKKGIPQYTAMRLQHYGAFLQGFDFDIEFRKSEEHGNVDCISRLPLKETSGYEMDEVDAIQVHLMERFPVTFAEIKTETGNDTDVTRLIEALKTGKVVPKEQRFGIDQTEFGLQQECLVKGMRVYIPATLRNRVLSELHEGHFGMSRMKALARNFCWWSGIDQEIEEKARNCSQCQLRKADPVQDKSHIWEEEKEAFERVHVDYAGPVQGKYLLILVDAYSKWPEVKVCGNMSTDTTIKKLREIFSTHGLPKVLVSDQGRQFMSQEFEVFCKMNGIIHKTGSPYHPATNGQAERFVRTFKEKLEILKDVESQDLERKLCNLLVIYRSTPHAATGVTPSCRLMNREIRTRLGLMLPTEEVKTRTVAVTPVKRAFDVGDRVAARNYVRGTKWRFGRILNRLGKVHYVIKLDDSRIWKRHINQLRKVGELVEESSSGESSIDEDQRFWAVEEDRSDIPHPENESEVRDENSNDSSNSLEGFSLYSGRGEDEIPDGVLTGCRRTCRIRRPPNRLNL
ncbi:uncharacterized protein K02A2.6-like [Phlebotomus argentipes]|uniref:uncharacterized protein K02A2.6-like n=1 Tax=Phlebotomus argentipes TaxID=94469 RepID=UPI002892EF28|nr:uncharacterized protein K02A2.6-like [Phlebotomus argentipes]